MELIVVLVFFNFLTCGLSEWDNRDYDDNDLASDEDIPEDWRSRIEQRTMDERLSELSTANLLEDDILYDDGDSFTSNNANSTNDKQTKLPQLWRNGKIPYQISPLFEGSTKSIIEESMRRIMIGTTGCITFHHRKSETKFVRFLPGDNCSSPVGVSGQGEQKIFPNETSCIVLGIVQHEILHTLGFYHEHSRPDRDEHVKIFRANIRKNAAKNFDIIPQMPSFDIGYDTESLMHYGVSDWSISPREPVILPKHGKNHTMGQRDGLSVRDVAKLRNAYECPVKYDDTITDQMYTIPKFSETPMRQEQCSLQFTAYCAPPFVTIDNCTKTWSLSIMCDSNATAEHLRSTASAVSKPPARAVFLGVLGIHITNPYAFDPVASQVVMVFITKCVSTHTTAKLPGLNFVNLLDLMLYDCRNQRILKADFDRLRKLRVIQFHGTTITYIEKGSFANLRFLKVFAPHILDENNSNRTDIQRYVRDIHCSCTFAWFRKWWVSNSNLKRSVKTGEVFEIGMGSLKSMGSKPLANRALKASDISFPVDCSRESLASTLQMVKSDRQEFSLNEPDCNDGQQKMSVPVVRLLDITPSVSFTQCMSQFNQKCTPGGSGDLDPGHYCANSHSRTVLQITCNESITTRELQDMAYAMATHGASLVVVLFDGHYVAYHTFSVARKQVIFWYLKNCLEPRSTLKLFTLKFINLFSFILENCHNLIIYKSDFASTPHLQVIGFQFTTISGLDNDAFTNLVHLKVLSLEYNLKWIPQSSIGKMADYLDKLHCSCQFASFRAVTSSLIALHTVKHPFTDNTSLVADNCEDFSPHSSLAYRLEWDDAEGPTAKRLIWCYKKIDLYYPMDCKTMSVDFNQTEYSINALACDSQERTEYMDAWALVINSSGDILASMKTSNMIQRVDRTIVEERRSQLTTVGLNEKGTPYYYDDQIERTEVSEDGKPSGTRLWPNNGKNIPYVVSSEFDVKDANAIIRALNEIQTKSLQCITFTKRAFEPDYIQFGPWKRCESCVGRQGGMQNITLTPACISRGTILHLMMHALGFYHETNRPDRDEYVTIYENHTASEAAGTVFRKISHLPGFVNKYDLLSIMHFGLYDYSNASNFELPVVIPNRGAQVKMGQRKTLSIGDLLKITTVYNCSIEDDKASLLEPFPTFTFDLLGSRYCDVIKSHRCLSGEVTSETCSEMNLLMIECDQNTNTDDLKALVAVMANSTPRATSLPLYDGLTAVPGVFLPVRRRVIKLFLNRCRNKRSTQILPIFRFNNLLELQIRFCRNLDVRKDDFRGFERLKIIMFALSTIKCLEVDTFAGVPSLEILTIESDLLEVTFLTEVDFPSWMRYSYLQKIHCSCDFAHFRSWRKNNGKLKREAELADIYYVERSTLNIGYTKGQMYYPVNCTALTIPVTGNFYNFSQVEYSVNEPVCDDIPFTPTAGSG